MSLDLSLPPHDSPMHPDDETMVVCEGLGKSYGDFHALVDCSLRVRRGEVFGLLGPNGAGKTTLIRSLLGYLHPTSGRCRVAGHDPQVDSVAVRRRVSYLPGDAHLPRHMNGRGAIGFFSQIHPDGDRERSLEVADALELDLSRRVAFMSTGMRQKLALAVVFGPRTPLLILDEPTANLDPTVRAKVLELVLSDRAAGRTVMFSSHVLSEIEQTCDRVAFLRRGKLALELSMQDLFQRHRVVGRSVSPRSEARWGVPPELRESTTLTQLDDGRVRIDTAGDLQPVLPWLATLPLSHVRIEPLGLHTIYQTVHLGHEPDEADADAIALLEEGAIAEGARS